MGVCNAETHYIWPAVIRELWALNMNISWCYLNTLNGLQSSFMFWKFWHQQWRGFWRAKNVMNYIKGTCKRQGCLQSSVKRWVLNFTILWKSRWLSQEKFLMCIFELRNDHYQYLNDERHRNAHMFLKCDFHTPLAYLGDASDKMNIL